MSKSTENRLVAERYAKAMLDLAGDAAPALANSAKSLNPALGAPDVKQFLHNPLLTRQQSAQIIGAVMAKIGAPELLSRVVARMAHNRRLAALPHMLEQFVLMVEKRQKIIRVKIISSKELSAQDVSALSEKIAQCYGCQLQVETEVNSALIGGVQLRMGDQLIDYSVAGKLARLSEFLKQSPLQNATSSKA